MTENLRLRLELIKDRNQLPVEWVERLGKFVQEAPDEKVFHVNVVDWAEENGLDENLALDLFLYAAYAGIFDMNWGVLCDRCGLRLTSPGALRSVERNQHCKLCRVNVEGTLDDRVDVCFDVSAAVRTIRYHDPSRASLRTDFAALMLSPSIQLSNFHSYLRQNLVDECWLQPGEARVLPVVLAAGYSVIFAPQIHALCAVELKPGCPSAAQIEFLDGQAIPATLALAPGKVELRVKNATDRPLLVGVEALVREGQEGPPPTTLTMRPFITGKRVLSNQTFRELFRTSAEGLEDGLSITHMALLFTDLQASTAMYERLGDLRALKVVREHFHVLERIVARNQGAVVKTIGDAVMASFAAPEFAMKAALEMNDHVAHIGRPETEVVLKVGIHAGPCVAIESNNQLDYFGRTVNLAARVQSVAEGGQIVVTESFWTPQVSGLVGPQWNQQIDHVALKGIDELVAVRRLRPA